MQKNFLLTHCKYMCVLYQIHLTVHFTCNKSDSFKCRESEKEEMTNVFIHIPFVIKKKISKAYIHTIHISHKRTNNE